MRVATLAWLTAMMHAALIVAAFVASLAAPRACGAVEVVDDSGARVMLAAPAKRIVSLAPHLTELLYAAGAGERVVGAVQFSDFPDAAKAIPRVGDVAMLDMERIGVMRPDLVVAWWHVTPELQLDRLRAFGIAVYYSEPKKLADIPRALTDLGKLAGTEPAARNAAAAFEARADRLRRSFAGRSKVPVFLQIWSTPLLTVNGEHLISEVVRLCGGSNIFADLAPLVPTVSAEAVIAAHPEAIVTTRDTPTADGAEELAVWQKLTRLPATSNHNLIVLDSDTISRQSPRILEGAEALCDRLESVRARRKP